jgi:hypothetical protein
VKVRLADLVLAGDLALLELHLAVAGKKYSGSSANFFT